MDTGDVEGGALPLVVLHGLFGSADNWRSHIKHWQTRRRVIAVDLRNHGRSPHIEGMAYPAMAKDVMALLDALEIERFDLLGHSMGGKVAITLARQHPQRVARLVVADVAPVAYGHGHDDVFAALRRVESAQPTSRKDADRVMAAVIDSVPTRQFLATNLVRDDDGIMRWRVGLDEIAADYEAIIAAPGGDSPYEGPTLLLRGSESHYVLDRYREAIEAVLPAVELRTLEGAGHWLHAEQPEAFREAVDAFLEDAET
ncbi:alpha/beta fold hydrolase [Salinicola avicenniae]|uniref:alpha/beta fold hydrolase n=1 Tax=Salinicola avicenniae TaxID=2916836 RepID=UPI002072B393|nr:MULTISPECIES: alpha/beta fold hydrolase [unclassified Salinicola]